MSNQWHHADDPAARKRPAVNLRALSLSSRLFGAALIAAFCIAVPSNGKQPDTATHWTKIDGYHGFQGWREQLQHMADQGSHFPVSHFCVIVATGSTAPPDNKFTWAYVYWREAAQLYTFGQSDEAMSDMTEFKAPLDLKKDVVATERQLKGSSYRVTRAWVADVLRHCATAGTQIVVRRSI